MVKAGVPVLLYGEAGNASAGRSDAQTVGAGQRLADVARQRDNEVGGADDRRQTEESGQLQRRSAGRASGPIAPVSNWWPVPETMTTCFSVWNARGKLCRSADDIALARHTQSCGNKCLLKKSRFEIRDQPERQIGLAGLQMPPGIGVDLGGIDARHPARTGAYA